MILISAVDNSMGLMFNGRRLSRDRALTNRILSIAAGKKLYPDEYSMELFKEAADQDLSAQAMESRVDFQVSEEPFMNAGEGEFCFIEDRAPSGFEDKIEQLYLYFWNRDYPSDLRFDLDMEGWRLIRSVPLQGNSHEKIDENIYVRNA